MALERTYTVPLRSEWSKVSRYKRAKKAVAGLRKFLVRHMKSDDVRLGKFLNLELWKHGMQNPPSRVKVVVKKFDDGVVRAELFGKQIEEPKKADEKKPEGVAEKVKKALGEKKAAEEKKPAEPKADEKKPATAKKAEAKPAAKKA